MLGIKKQERYKEIEIEKEDIVVRDGNKYLIVLPYIENDELEDKQYKLNGYKFWFPKKLVDETEERIVLKYDREFEFRLFKQEKNSEGKYITVDNLVFSGDKLVKELQNCLKDYERLEKK